MIVGSFIITFEFFDVFTDWLAQLEIDKSLKTLKIIYLFFVISSTILFLFAFYKRFIILKLNFKIWWYGKMNIKTLNSVQKILSEKELET